MASEQQPPPPPVEQPVVAATEQPGASEQQPTEAVPQPCAEQSRESAAQQPTPSTSGSGKREPALLRTFSTSALRIKGKFSFWERLHSCPTSGRYGGHVLG